MTTIPRTATILLVEDDDGEAKAVQRAFAKANIANPILRCEDGKHAWDALKGEGGRSALKTPFILLVDINLPRMSGIDLIRKMRGDDALKKSVVFVLTTSKRDEDKEQAYDLSVAGYIVKETAGRDFLNLATMIDRFLRVVELPEL